MLEIDDRERFSLRRSLVRGSLLPRSRINLARLYVTLPSGEIPLDELNFLDREHDGSGCFIFLFAFDARPFDFVHERLNQRFALSSLHFLRSSPFSLAS